MGTVTKDTSIILILCEKLAVVKSVVKIKVQRVLMYTLSNNCLGSERGRKGRGVGRGGKGEGVEGG